MNDLEFEIKSRVAKYGENSYLCYGQCEEVAFDIAFPKGHKVLKRDEDNDYQGSTRIDIESDGKLYHCEYSWGSCGGCDTLEGDGHEATIKMILENIEPQTTQTQESQS